jgi:hypothetical protein
MVNELVIAINWKDLKLKKSELGEKCGVEISKFWCIYVSLFHFPGGASLQPKDNLNKRGGSI